jgi:hypothetical protein
MITISDPYSDYVPPDHQRNFVEEKRITREILRIIADIPDDMCVGDLVHGDVLLLPEGISEDLRAWIVALEPYLRWAAGKEANAWLPGGPANIPVEAA